ncbi:hypothetical protein AXF42_Ash021814 [Apostasia shenzhenica]|uniref:Uncharacterized protein n=1 Tax=Apostasia shenzhenica TaxID=1088818 RepID=A0A2I0A098_9ASPA|nr:hypothetical protein AXF42_Ash021814 [Apostasia shenzhenica]
MELDRQKTKKIGDDIVFVAGENPHADIKPQLLRINQCDCFLSSAKKMKEKYTNIFLGRAAAGILVNWLPADLNCRRACVAPGWLASHPVESCAY